jgi:hypothetical protein
VIVEVLESDSSFVSDIERDIEVLSVGDIEKLNDRLNVMDWLDVSDNESEVLTDAVMVGEPLAVLLGDVVTAGDVEYVGELDNDGSSVVEDVGV